jgi:hypothetical protein
MSTGVTPIVLPPANPIRNPGATQAVAPIYPDPHVTRDANIAARAIIALDRTDNPVNDKLRQRDTRELNGQLRKSVAEHRASQKAKGRAEPATQARVYPAKSSYAHRAFTETESEQTETPSALDNVV